MFPMARVAPIMGRTLTDDDATAAAPPVMLLGERIWRERFAADPAIVGKTLLVSETPTTVVGVMPAEFRFPSIYEVWQPLKIEEAAAKPRAGIGIRIWARLKPGVTHEQADAELAVLSARAAADWPATHEHLRATVGSPVESEVSNPEERTLLASANIFVALLVLLVSGNVALLMFARAATRESEILVRTALGASRGRLVGPVSCGGTRAEHDRGGHWSRAGAAGDGVGRHYVHGRGQRRGVAPVLDYAEPAADFDRLRHRACDSCRRRDRHSAGGQDDAGGLVAAARDHRGRWRSLIRRCLDRGHRPANRRDDGVSGNHVLSQGRRPPHRDAADRCAAGTVPFGAPWARKQHDSSAIRSHRSPRARGAGGSTGRRRA